MCMPALNDPAFFKHTLLRFAHDTSLSAYLFYRFACNGMTLIVDAPTTAKLISNTLTRRGTTIEGASRPTSAMEIDMK